jgi:hypothetical protein
MTRFHAFSVSAVLALALMTSAASALSLRAPVPGDTGGCAVLCGSDDPKNPGNPDNPDKPGLSKAEAAFQTCGDKLATLRKVTGNSIKAIGNDASVKVIPVCEMQTLAGSDAEQAFINRGNAVGLTGLIGSKPVLNAELGKSSHAADDVVGVIVDHANVTLYVHKR